jgi:hypothetical protein
MGDRAHLRHARVGVRGATAGLMVGGPSDLG